MPKQMTFTREIVLNTTYELVRKEGINGINARKIAKQLNSSVHPIFRHFKDMEQLKKEVYKKIYDKYKEYMLSGINEEKAYKKMGLSYIKFAKDYPEFFKIMFMQQTKHNAENFVMNDSMGDNVIKVGQKLTGLSFDKQKQFHVKVWIFTHGIACLVSTKTINFSDKEIDELLEKTVLELLSGLKKEGENNGKCYRSKKFNKTI